MVKKAPDSSVSFHKASQPGQLSLLQLDADLSQNTRQRSRVHHKHRMHMRDPEDMNDLTQTQTSNVNKGLASMLGEIETEEIIDH